MSHCLNVPSWSLHENQSKEIYFLCRGVIEIRTVFVSTAKTKPLLLFTRNCFLANMSCAQLHQVDSGLDHLIRSCLFKAAV